MTWIKNKTLKLLKWVEKYTKTDMLYLFKGGFWLTLGQGLSSLTAFISSIFFANLLSPTVFGTYKYILSLYSSLSAFTLDGVNTAVASMTARYGNQPMKPALVSRIRWSLIATGLALILSAYYFVHGNNEISTALGILSLVLPFTESFTVYESVLQGSKNYRLGTVITSISNVILATIMICTILLTHNVIYMIIAYFTTVILIRVGSFLYVNHTLVFNTVHTKFNEAIKFGKHLSIMNIITICVYNLDRILIFHFLGAEQLALYSIAIAPGDQIKGVFTTVGTLSLPKFSEEKQINDRDTKSSITHKTFILLGGILFAIVLYFMIAPFIFPFVFPKYPTALFLSELYTISLLGLFSILPLSFLQAKNSTRYLYVYNLCSALIQIILMIVGVLYFGLIGIITARIFSRIINGLLALGLARL